jgi:hypothetical protein
VLELSREPIPLDDFCGRHSAPKEAVFAALLEVARSLMQELEDKEGALILAEQEIATAKEERDNMKRLNARYVRRISSRKAEVHSLSRDIGGKEDAEMGAGPTWQRLRSERNSLRKQNATLRWQISRHDAEANELNERLPSVAGRHREVEEEEEGRDEEPGGDDTFERGVCAEEELRDETQPSPSVVNAGDLINFMAHPNEGISPGLGRLWRLALTAATRAMNQVLAKQTVSMRGVRYDDDIKMAGALTYLWGGVLDEDNAPRMGSSE